MTCKGAHFFVVMCMDYTKQIANFESLIVSEVLWSVFYFGDMFGSMLNFGDIFGSAFYFCDVYGFHKKLSAIYEALTVSDVNEFVVRV